MKNLLGKTSIASLAAKLHKYRNTTSISLTHQYNYSSLLSLIALFILSVSIHECMGIELFLFNIVRKDITPERINVVFCVSPYPIFCFKSPVLFSWFACRSLIGAMADLCPVLQINTQWGVQFYQFIHKGESSLSKGCHIYFSLMILFFFPDPSVFASITILCSTS